MADDKKHIPWLEIKARYMRGEFPRDIAPDYGITRRQISDKAHNEGWVAHKNRIRDAITEHAENDLKELSDLTFAVHKDFMRTLKGQMKDITNPYLFDGERTNSLFQTAMNNSVKLIIAAMKSKDDDTAEEETPGFNVTPDA